MSHNIILNHVEIQHKIKRIAFQIYENFVHDESIVIAGIASNGYILATKIAEELERIAPLKVVLCEVTINKQQPNQPIQTSLAESEYANKGVVLVDDVLNSGTTLIYGVKHFLNTPLNKLKTAVLIDRNHKKYPVKVDFKGLSLSTSSKEHVSVEFENNQGMAYLS